MWSESVGPYGPWQVQPSGTFQPLNITINMGDGVEQDIVMQSSALAVRDFFEPTTYATPAAVPVSGDWTATLGSLGNGDYFWINGQADRTLTLEVTSLDDSKAASETKAQPVMGMWALADPGTFPAPAKTVMAFNSTTFGMTQMNADLQASGGFRIGIFDYRGDGRPDYHYQARVFHADNIVPTRVRVDGGTAITVQGLGLSFQYDGDYRGCSRARAGGLRESSDDLNHAHGGWPPEHNADRSDYGSLIRNDQRSDLRGGSE